MSRMRGRHTPSTSAGRKLADLAAREVQVTQDPWPQIAARLRHSQPGTATHTSWSGPAVDPAARRRTAASSSLEREEHRVSTDLSQVRPEPIPVHKRSWSNEVLKLAAACIAFGIIGMVLVLLLRGGGEQPTVPGVVVSPTAEAPATRQSTPVVQNYQDRQGQTVEVSAWVSDFAPPADTDVTVSARILVSGQPVSGVSVMTLWGRRDTVVSLQATTGADGVATFTLSSGPTKGGLIDVRVDFFYGGQTYLTSVVFTTQP